MINNENTLFKLTFGSDFLKHHAGQIVTDQNYAIIELVANSWDAGTTKLQIKWPEEGGQMLFSDNGIGMTKDELLYRWGKLNYNRLNEQGGKEAKFPKNTKHGSRIVFGRNGVGRHAMFCFNNEYEIKTKKDGQYTHVKVISSTNTDKPFDVKVIEYSDIPEGEHGTDILTNIDKNYIHLISTDKVIEVIGSRFISDPQFIASVNGHKVQMTDVSHLTENFTVNIDNKSVTIKRILGEKGKNSKQNGIAWWFNNRLVGNPNWNSFDGGLIDGRHPIAKSVLYIVNANVIDPNNVKKDWSGFYITPDVLKVINAVHDFVREDLRNLLYETRKERRLLAYESNKRELKSLSKESRETIISFLEEVQNKCPTIGPQELHTTVEVLAKLEKARSGYELLERLALLNSKEIDNLNEILSQWTVDDAKKVLGELRWRLELISKLDYLLENSDSDELHDLQPLFERGLWIFGPEFESISFISNRSLSTVIKTLLGGGQIENEARRPDFVVLPNSSLGVYSCDSHTENHEINDFNKVVIVELKRAGIPIDSEQKDQALLYARELRKSKKVSLTTPIIAYVLGSEIAPDANAEFTDGPIKIIPKRYNIILNQAHARTFSLLKRIEELKHITYSNELDEIIGPSSQVDLFNLPKS